LALLFIPAIKSRAAAGAPANRTAQIADLSTLQGDAVNTLDRPVDRPTAQGVFRKLPGERRWQFVPVVSDAGIASAEQEARDRYLRRHGKDLVSVWLDVPSSGIADTLLAHGMVVGTAPPCSLSTTLTVSDLFGLARAGVMSWKQGTPRPSHRPRAPETRRKLSAATARVLTGAEPPVTPASAWGGFPKTEADVTVFFDGFETYSVPGEIWAADDLNPADDYVYWSDEPSDIAAVHSGSYSAWCAGSAAGVNLYSYANNQSAYMSTLSPGIDMTNYYQFGGFYWVSYSTEFNADWFTSYYNYGFGWVKIDSLSGGTGEWTQRGIPIVDNTGHLADHVNLMMGVLF